MEERGQEPANPPATRADDASGVQSHRTQVAHELAHIALRTSVIYAVVAALWIVLSDRILLYITLDPRVMSVWASVKGLVFVLTTAALLYWTLRRQLGRWEQEAAARLQAQQALHRSELQTNQSRDAILVVRRDDGHILQANAAATSTYGFSREEWMALTIHDLYEDTDKATVRDRMAEADAKGILFETAHRRKDGSMIPVEVSSQGANSGGQRVLISVIRDITERKRAEEAVRASEERFRQVAENIQEVFWLTDVENSGMLYVSPAYERIWGRSCQSLYGQPRSWRDAIHQEDRKRVVAAFPKQATGEFNEEYRIIRPDGEVRHIHDRAFPVRNAQGEVYRIAGVAEDVTERRKLEAQFHQTQKIEEIGQLAAGITHDFNNLLTVIQMHVSLLEKTSGLTPEVTASVREISDSAKRAATLTGQLLTFSRRHVMELKDLDLSSIVANVSRMLARILGEDIRVELKYASTPLAIHADLGMIEQVLLNLVVNARDAMPKGGTLVIQTATVELDSAATREMPQSRAGSFVCLSVSDTGMGIPPEVLPRIFEPFFTTKDVSRGTGLGLATVYGIVQQHKGWITVESEANRGSTFRVYLPRGSSPTSGSRSPTPAAHPERGGNETILLVEDEAPVRMLVQAVLGRFGYRVLEATTGAAALEVWKTNHKEIQLLLTDYLMPDGMTGLELARKLNQENPRLRVILTSGYGPEIARRDPALDSTIVFLPKPFEVNRLISAVRSCLDSPPSQP